ncbi:MAG: hypothetical protein HZC02_01590 [Candidatus Levybacteria bacterium]|nr:hypothetical protein [Candidatus Levybacteria bacterium]
MTKNRLLDLKKLKFEVRDVMRYDDAGDYFANTIVAYDFKDDVITNAIFLHEFIEYMLIKSSGIEPELIDKLDTVPNAEKDYPREWKLYEKYHDMANSVERQFIENLGLNWEEYDKTVNTAKIKTAVRHLSDEMHKKQMDKKDITKAKRIVRAIFRKRK